MNSCKYNKEKIRKANLPKLTSEQIKAAKAYYKSKGFKLKNTYSHRYYTGITGIFYKDYLPLDIFRPIISPKLNQKRQWPALLDKNITYNLFKDFKQPGRVVQNINGFYYIDDKIVNEEQAMNACNQSTKPLVIKPSIESGKGKMVEIFTAKNNITSLDGLAVLDLFKLYKKDFIIQEQVEQSNTMKALNPSSLNTLRIVSYLNKDGVHILASAVRIGGTKSKTDNFSGGGAFCGIDNFGNFKGKGYTMTGKVIDKTDTDIVLKGLAVPNYDAVIDMVKNMHTIVPYFRIVSWDIGIDVDDEPVFIEYNTYYQTMEIQIPCGPLLGDFTDEILALGLKK